MAVWQVQNAKAHFSAMVEQAQNEGPQTITKHGMERAVLLSVDDYRALLSQKPNFLAYLLGGPTSEDFDLGRDSDTGRTIDL